MTIPAATQRRCRDKQLHRGHRQNIAALGEICIRSQHRLEIANLFEVIAHSKSTTERRQHQVIVALLKHHVFHSRWRHATLPRMELRTPIKTDVQAKFRTHQHDILILEIFDHGFHGAIFWQSLRDFRPRSATVAALVYKGLKIPKSMVIQNRIHIA